MSPIHSHLVAQLRAEDLRRTAERERLVAALRRQRPAVLGSARQRLGFRLVEVGLRLAATEDVRALRGG